MPGRNRNPNRYVWQKKAIEKYLMKETHAMERTFENRFFGMISITL